MRRRLIAFTAAILALPFLLSCSVSLKQKVVLSLQAQHQVLAALDDTELAVFQSKTIPALTVERHRAFSAALAKAYRAESKAAGALQTWRAGDPAPTNITELIAVADETWHEVVLVIPRLEAKTPAEESLVGKLQVWLDQIRAIGKLVGAPVPAWSK